MPVSHVENIDCMEAMKGFEDKFFDLAIVDPPYGIGEDGRKTESRAYSKPDKRNGRMMKFRRKPYNNSRYDDTIPPPEYFSELKRVSKNQIIWGENYFPQHFGSGRIFWNKCASGDFSDGEIAYCSLHDSTRMFTYMWNGFRQGESIANGGKMQGNHKLWENRIHPNHKPIALYQWLIKNYAQPGDKILDTHLGSGSSRIAAYKMGFDFYGYEIDKDYFEAQEKRFKTAIAEPLFDNVKVE